MTAEITTDEWVRFLREEYVTSFVKDGGASVKFAVAPDGGVGRLAATLDDLARGEGYLTARVDAAVTRVHMMDQVFFGVAEQIPWEGLARSVVRKLAQRGGYVVPTPDDSPLLDALTAANDLGPDFLRMELMRKVQDGVFKRRSLAKDFRVAMSQLCLAQLAGGEDGATTTRAITEWLTGQVKTVGAVKPYQIFTRINRNNARFMFESLLDWIRFAEHAGLMLLLDITRVTLAPNPRDGFVSYTKASRLDAYEVLRQFIDAIDRLHSLLLLALPAVEFLDDSSGGRGIGEYQALKFRVYDEVRDLRLVNPMATLVRLSDDQGGGSLREAQ